MGVKDTVTTKYMRQNEVFADTFNYFVYGGTQVISPDSLEELDTREIDVPYGGEKGAKQPVQKNRDVIKSAVVMKDNRAAYLLMAIENQSNIHYAMPVKNMVYDALQYAKQVEIATASHKMSGDYRHTDSDEYLSGFMKDDRLLPVVTLVVYFGSKEWTGPLSVHGMFDKQDERVLAIVPDYKINLLAPALINDKDFKKFHSSLKDVLLFIKYSEDKDVLINILNANESFHHLGRKEVDVLNACVGAKIEVKKDEEAVDVCLAIQQMKEEAAQEAYKKGYNEAYKEASKKVSKKTAKKTRISTLCSDIKSLMEKMGLSIEQSMDVLSVSDSDRKAIWQLLK